MALRSFFRCRPKSAMSVRVLAPLKIAVAAKVSIAAKGCLLPLASRGSGKHRNSSYNDGIVGSAAFAFMILNLLEVENRHFIYGNLGELKSPGCAAHENLTERG